MLSVVDIVIITCLMAIMIMLAFIIEEPVRDAKYRREWERRQRRQETYERLKKREL